MDRFDEMRFAWALVDVARPFLNTRAHSWLCVRIGAGEYRGAIIELLHGFVVRDVELPLALAPALGVWVDGFIGSESEDSLRTLGLRLRLGPNIPEIVPPPPPALVARRPYAAMKRRAARLRLLPSKGATPRSA